MCAKGKLVVSLVISTYSHIGNMVCGAALKSISLLIVKYY